MTGRRLTAATVLAACALLAVAGCTAVPGGPGATPTDSPSDHDGTPPTPDDTPRHSTPTQVPYEAHVFDSGGVGSPLIEGGISYGDDDEYTGKHYVTVIDSAAAAAERFNHSLLRGNASRFVDETDFANASLVVVQTFPASSVPDYRVESVTREGGELRVRVNRSSRYATDDITVETVLLRVQGTAPESVTVITARGATFSTESGVVTETSEPTPTPKPSVELPHAGDDTAENVEAARGLRVENAGDEVNGFEVTVTYHDVPECRDDETPCGEPTETVDIYRHLGKLRPGTNHTVAELALRRGNYTVTVSAELPADDGSRRSVTEQFQWHLDDEADDVVVTVTDDDLSVRAADGGE